MAHPQNTSRHITPHSTTFRLSTGITASFSHADTDDRSGHFWSSVRRSPQPFPFGFACTGGGGANCAFFMPFPTPLSSTLCASLPSTITTFPVSSSLSVPPMSSVYLFRSFCGNFLCRSIAKSRAASWRPLT
eukprot:TRINITY_DN8340_c0_g1_i1.p1 TRINITY_DN8340_c0_g1~~TRINITY_DN8340_c0_g1_i1.p1  ORF type:complete len:132 (-),score=2.56 TRINITY_DN8340_c0_g1_i1:1-396(-)